MENEKKINWLSLFIRVVIIFVFALIIIWLFTKIFGKNKLSETFTSNLNNMETVSIEYFKTIDLPLVKGESIKMTLEELIEKDLITLISKDKDSKCDTKASYSEITRERDRYLVTTKLKCGKEENTIKKIFSLKDCKNCNNSSTSESNNPSENSTSTTPNNNSSTSTKVTYYEYVKETTSYSKWMRGPKTGPNIENKYEYYSIAYKEYYTLGVIPKGQNSISYTIKLNTVPNSKYYFTIIDEVSSLEASDEKYYLNTKDVSITSGLTYEGSLSESEISKYSLSKDDFTYHLSPYYRKGSFYVDVSINLVNTTNATSYHDSKLKKDIYLVPLKIKVKFASDQITSVKPNGEYETIPYYRYVTVTRDVIWSAEDHVDGYVKTGQTKVE